MMRRNFINKISTIVIASVFVIAIMFAADGVSYAMEGTYGIEGKQYELEEKSKYSYTQEMTSLPISNTGSQFGLFTITGNLTRITAVGGCTAYRVDNGIVTLSYDPTGDIVNATETSWHLCEDDSTEVNGEKLPDKIKLGAIILQTSSDKNYWTTDLVNTDIANAESGYASDFYETKEIQLINGCYYRVVVAYKIERQIEKESMISSDTEVQKYVEEYEFYLRDDTAATIAAGAHPDTMKVVGDQTKVVNTGKDNGFSGQDTIDSDDPHYGWSLGKFTLGGFTNSAIYQGEEYFLKNYGDVITLNFLLEQDISCLNGKTNLSIYSDTNGWDQYFQIEKTEFKHGTLIIRKTDYQGNMSDPIIYIDYLAAYARTGADTRVQFFEEGDYEVALDYEILDDTRIDEYYNYRMFFTFKIRNGNSMVYAFDKGTGSQMFDKTWTSSGFVIDTAASHYLTITVEKYVVVDDATGKKLDLSWSKTASDGDSYTENGIYIVSVSNMYQPNGDISKTYYVGDDPYVRAIASTGKSLDEIVSLEKEGYYISDSGDLFAPTNSEQEGALDDNGDAKPELSQDISEDSDLETYKVTEEDQILIPPMNIARDQRKNIIVYIVAFLVVVLGISVLASRKIKKSKKVYDVDNSDSSSDKKGNES